MPEEMPTRNLTDADVAALSRALTQPVAQAIKVQLVEDFQLEVGRTVIIWFRRTLIGLIIALAIWASSHAYNPDYPTDSHK